MERVLIVSSSDKSKSNIDELLKYSFNVETFYVSNCSEARRKLIEGDFDLIIINTPLYDEFGNDLAIKAAQSSLSGIILIVKNDFLDSISLKVEDYGVFILTKPINRQMFYIGVKMALTARKRLISVGKETLKLKKKIEEIKLVDKAKCLLIQYKNLTEEQAHKLIERNAMNLRKTKINIANDIINNYEN